MTPESMIAAQHIEDADGIHATRDIQAADLQVELFRSALREVLEDGAPQDEAEIAGQLPAVQSFFA